MATDYSWVGPLITAGLNYYGDKKNRDKFGETQELPLTESEQWQFDKQKELYDYSPARDYVGQSAHGMMQGIQGNMSAQNPQFASGAMKDFKMPQFNAPIDFSNLPKFWEKGAYTGGGGAAGGGAASPAPTTGSGGGLGLGATGVDNLPTLGVPLKQAPEQNYTGELLPGSFDPDAMFHGSDAWQSMSEADRRGGLELKTGQPGDIGSAEGQSWLSRAGQWLAARAPQIGWAAAAAVAGSLFGPLGAAVVNAAKGIAGSGQPSGGGDPFEGSGLYGEGQ
jgi:hypothetical protein